jgi:hypothetical protein
MSERRKMFRRSSEHAKDERCYSCPHRRADHGGERGMGSCRLCRCTRFRRYAAPTAAGFDPAEEP